MRTCWKNMPRLGPVPAARLPGAIMQLRTMILGEGGGGDSLVAAVAELVVVGAGRPEPDAAAAAAG